MPLRSSPPARWAWFSPWMIMGSVCILAAILLILAIKNVHREKAFMERALLSQANVLMRSIEAGSRTGMMGMGWGERQNQMLLEETAQQPDVLYVALVNATGRIVVHSDSEQVGGTVPVPLPQAGQMSHRFVTEGQNAFEVIRAYQPWFRPHRRGFRDRGSREMPPPRHPYGMPGEERNLYIVVGMDPTPFEQAHRQDVNQTALLFVMMFLVGAAGLVSLFWAQHYRAARRSLQDIEAFTSTVVNQMPVGLIATDREGRIQRSNEAAQLILRRPAGFGGDISDFYCFKPIARQLKQAEAVVEQEVHCRINEKESVPLLVNAVVVRDGEARTAGYAFLFADVTRIKHLEEQLRRSERLASLGRLAAGVAHEIRNPLSSIKGFAAILAGKFKEGDSSKKIAQVMEGEVERLNRVVTELLDFARPTELHKQPTRCRDLIAHTLQLVEGDAHHRGVRLESTVTPDDLHVDVDPDRFAQVLLNLYLNALQAMESGGALKVEAFQDNGHPVLSVSDSGRGIPAEHLPHIFDPYFTTKPQGVGLGLANVHKLVEAHGGEIEVASLTDRGTRFTIRLPETE